MPMIMNEMDALIEINKQLTRIADLLEKKYGDLKMSEYMETKNNNKKTLLDLFEDGTLKEFRDKLYSLDDIDSKQKLLFCMKKLNYFELKKINKKLDIIISQKEK